MSKYFRKIKNIPKRVEREIETRKYKRNIFAKYLNIMNVEESISFLENNEVSFYRYGDGEIAIMLGDGIPFQKYDEKLAKRLIDLLKLKNEKIKVAIPYYYFNYEKNLIPMIEEFAYAMKKQRRFLIENCNKEEKYLDTSISQTYQSYETYNFETYFKRVKQLFVQKDITLISGENVLKHIDFNLLEQAKSVEYIIAPSRDAFDGYEEIYAKALEIPKNRLVCIVLGPTAKPLVYDLAQQGYQAWDLGHFLKDYDSFMKKNARDVETITKFYKPD